MCQGNPLYFFNFKVSYGQMFDDAMLSGRKYLVTT